MGPLVLRAKNALLKKHLRRQASRLGLEFVEFTNEKLVSPKMLVAELEKPGLSSAKRYAVKKQFLKAKSDMLKEKARLEREKHKK